MDSNHPDQLGRYEIIEVLGQGAMGVVYRARDALLGRSVALKTIHPSLLAGETREELLERFKREAQIAGRCQHRNIVTIYDYGIDQNTPFIAMEYVEGTDLKGYTVVGSLLSVQAAADIMLQVLEAVGYAHCAGIVHRDIKPANIILLQSNLVKVTDFGVARLLSSELTRTGFTFGTLNYMAPELFQGKKAEKCADIFSVGVVLYELLTGQKPFPNLTSFKASLEAFSAIPEYPSTLNPRIPQSFDRPVLKALEKNPQKRHESATVFAASLANAIANSQSSLSDPASQTDTKSANSTTATTKLMQPTVVNQKPRTNDSLSLQSLQAVENHLAEFVGPMAKMIVKRASREVHTIAELYQHLSKYIPDPEESKEFRRKASSIVKTEINPPAKITAQARSDRGGTTTAESGISRFTPEELNQVTLQLTVYLGPMSKMMVQKASRQATSVEDLYHLLAEHLSNESERRSFLSNIPKF